jgi:SAM-dependent methyltransferase
MEREEWNRRYASAELLWSATPNSILVGQVVHRPGGRALDVGCGEGRNSIWLAEHGWRVTGVDFSDAGLDKARRLAAAKGVSADWVLADLRSYRPAPRSYDLVVVLYLHLPSDELGPVHAACADALRPAGVLIVLGHDLTNLTEGYGGPQEASVLITPEDVAGDISAVEGVTVERAERVERRVSTDTGERVAIDALVRAVRS